VTKKKIKNKKVTWLILGTTFILLLFVLVNTQDQTIKKEQEITETFLDGNFQSLIINGEIDEKRLMELKDQSFEEMKDMLGVKRNFCIYFEDEDGNLVTINNPDDPQVPIHGIGSSDITIGGKACE